MKKYLSFIFVALLPVFASAETVQIDGIWYNLTIENRYAEVTYGSSKYTGDIIIPAAITYADINYSVTSIGFQAFYKNTSLTSVSLPNSIISIGKDAFYECSNLTTVTIGNNVTNIGEYAFKNCINLVPFSLPENLTNLGGSAFEGCNKFTSIVIPNGVTILEGGVFRSCNLKSIVLHENIKQIKDWALVGNSYSMNIYCHAQTPPTIQSLAFVQYTTDYMNNYIAAHDDFVLHVPATAVEAYKAKSPWKYFKSIEALIEITISQTTATLAKGETLALAATVTPDETENKAVTWSSSNSDVASVSDEGVVTALTAGTATITATACDGSYVKAACEVIVEEVTPTTVTLNISQYGSSTYCSEYALDFSEVKGLKAYTATGYNTSTQSITLVRVMTAKAGVGLFLKGELGEYTIPTLEYTADNSLNMLKGTLEPTVLNSTSNDGQYRNYRYTTGPDGPTPMFYRMNDDYTLSANKAYLQVPTTWFSTEAKSIALRFDEGEGTDIEEIESENKHSESIYDLMGRKVSNPQKRCIYIVNGKKIVY